MIAGATRGAGGVALSRHLLATKDGQRVLVMPSRGLAAEDLKSQIAEMVADAAHGRTDRPVHHVHVDPPPEAANSNEIIGVFLRHYEAEFGLQDAQRCGVFHLKDGRRHAHVVYSLVNDAGRVADLRHEYARREKVSRITEFECGLPMVKGKHNRAVAQALRKQGREDVAAAMEAAGLLAGRRPVAHSTPRQRAQAERTSVPLDDVRNAAFAAWTTSDDARSFVAALHASGFDVANGESGLVLVDQSAGAHALTRTIAAAARAAGGEKVTAAAVRRRLAGIEFPSVGEVKNGRAERRNPQGSNGRPTELGATVAPPGPSQGAGRRDESNRRTESPSIRDRGNPGPSHADARAARKRLRDDDTVKQIGSLDLQDINRAKGAVMKVIRTQNFKADLLAKIAPTGFNAHSFANDLRMVKMPTPGRPAARITMNDGGWIEIDATRRIVRTWGPTGRAQVLAGAIASLMGVEVEHLMKTAAVGADAADALKVTKLSEDKIKALAMWWSARGYVGIAGPDGCWVDVGNARILDTGAELEIHGGVTDEAVNAILLKARDAWKGNITLDGHWTQAEQDRLWIAAQRQGITVENCRPSQMIQTAWRREQDSAAKSVRTISSVRSEMIDAQDLIAAAHGDKNSVIRLPGPLQAFVAIYLDDEQRRHLAAQSVADVIPQLARFRDLGAAELEAWEQKTGRKFKPAAPESEKRGEENRLEMR